MNAEFERLNALKAAWDALQPLTSENETRLWKKFRMLWNYHSNHIEGNTLTYGETELLLLHDKAIGNHAHRDYLEMKAHELGIVHVRSLAADLNRLITESDIRDLNKLAGRYGAWSVVIEDLDIIIDALGVTLSVRFHQLESALFKLFDSALLLFFHDLDSKLLGQG
jgi:hypothetical protein